MSSLEDSQNDIKDIEKEIERLKIRIEINAKYCREEESVEFMENPGWVGTIEELRDLEKEMNNRALKKFRAHRWGRTARFSIFGF